MPAEPLILDGGNVTLYHGDCLDILPTLAVTASPGTGESE